MPKPNLTKEQKQEMYEEIEGSLGDALDTAIHLGDAKIIEVIEDAICQI